MSIEPGQIRIGCAGWNIPRDEKPNFPDSGTHLERYAARFSTVEINSSFYRSHRTATYARWAASVPENFRFSVKIPKAITHAARLENFADPLARFLDEVAGLGPKLGCLLVQLPPSLACEAKIARDFFESLRTWTEVPVAFEPRHASWFVFPVEAILEEFRISRVRADPAPVPEAAEPGGFRDFTYSRLHGAPHIYYSTYDSSYLNGLAARLILGSEAARASWCIFDNTALGAAIPNARELGAELERIAGSKSVVTA